MFILYYIPAIYLYINMFELLFSIIYYSVQHFLRIVSLYREQNSCIILLNVHGSLVIEYLLFHYYIDCTIQLWKYTVNTYINTYYIIFKSCYDRNDECISLYNSKTYTYTKE